MIIVSRAGERIPVEPQPFNNEDELKEKLLSNINIIPISDISEKDEKIVAWREEFPVEGGAIDVVGVGDGGGVYLIETKLYKNKDRRQIIGQALDYAAGLWRKFSYDVEAFIERLKENGQGEIPQDEEFIGSLADNLRHAAFNILVAMDVIDVQVKDLINFFNKNTNFRLLALELKRYIGEGLEIIVPEIYGEEIRREQTIRRKPVWTLKILKNEIEKISDEVLKQRVSQILEFAEKNGLFQQLRDRDSPGFGIKNDRGKLILTVDLDGGLHFYIGFQEKSRYESEDIRYRFIEDLKRLGLLSQYVNPDKVKSGKSSEREIHKLTDSEFNDFLNVLERYLRS